MPKGKQSIQGESPDKQPLQRAALTLAEEPLRDASDGTLPDGIDPIQWTG